MKEIDKSSPCIRVSKITWHRHKGVNRPLATSPVEMPASGVCAVLPVPRSRYFSMPYTRLLMKSGATLDVAERADKVQALLAASKQAV